MVLAKSLQKVAEKVVDKFGGDAIIRQEAVARAEELGYVFTIEEDPLVFA
jgi:hypothetical protein